jgi:uncharacterized protein
MVKRVFLVHGWDGSPKKDWLPWLSSELQKHGFSVHAPAMPRPEEPVIGAWVAALAHAVGTPDEHTYFVGHSIGCQTIMRYLETRAEHVGGIVFVAGWTSITPDRDDEESQRIAEPWEKTPIDYITVQQRTKHITAFFSQDDPVVPIGNADVFRENLSATVIIEDGMGHYSASEGVEAVPQVRDALLKIAKGI